MKRKMIGASAAYIAGLFFASFFMGAIPLLLIAAAVILIGKLNRFVRADYILIIVSFAAAVTLGTLYTRLHYDKIIAHDGETVSFTGEVTDIRQYSGELASYVIKGELGGKSSVRVTFYGSDLGARLGDRITLTDCELSVIEGDYLTDSMNFFRSERVYLSANNAKSTEVEHTNTHKLRNALADYREKVVSEFRAELGETGGEFLSGMVFGEKQGLDDDVRLSMYRCGTAHVLAVSGLHVSIAAAALMSLLRLLKVNRFAAFAAMEALLALLIIMANSPVSAIRAAVMMNFLYSAELFRRRTDPLNSLAAALLLICLVNPYAVYSSGLILSAAGTFGIGTFALYMTKNFPNEGIRWKFMRSVTAMLCTMLCVTPFTMKFFEESSLIAPLANVLIVPLCSVTVVIGLLYTVTGGTVSLLGFAGMFIRFVLNVSDKLSETGTLYFACRSDRIAGLAIALAAAVAFVQIIFGKRAITAAAVAAACSVTFIASAADMMSRRECFTIAVLGRNGNAAAVISYRGKTDIIDLSGHYKSPDYVRKYMLENAVDSAESLVLTSRVHSQYSAYEGKLEPFNVEKVIAVGEVPVAGAEDDSLQNVEAYTSDNGSYKVGYSDGVLTVSFGEAEAVILPVKMHDEAGEGFAVFYGSGTSGHENSDSAVYKCAENGTDNFEVTLTRDGGHRIRRL